MIIDTHTHLNFKAFDPDRDQVISEAVNSGVSKMIVVGTNVETSASAVNLASKQDVLYASVGIHPHHAKKFLHLSHKDQKKHIDQDINEIKKLAEHNWVVAIGEVGLDHYQYNSNIYPELTTDQDWQQLFQIQQQLLTKQLELAQQLTLPVILHSRQLKDQVLQTVISVSTPSSPITGVFHCFEGSKKYLQQIIQQGFYISFTGNITYLPDRQPVANQVPLDRLLLETDSPFMSPKPFRNSRNQPANIIHIANHHAAQRQLTPSTLTYQTSQNALKLFPRIKI